MHVLVLWIVPILPIYYLEKNKLPTLILLIAVDTLGGNGNIWKLVTQVMVIVVNYVGSKLLVFKKK